MGSTVLLRISNASDRVSPGGIHDKLKQVIIHRRSTFFRFSCCRPAPATTPHFNMQGVCGICGICKRTSPRIYTQGWTCLNAQCPLFWAYCGRLSAQLSYCPGFLALRVLPQFPPGFDNSLIPQHPVSASPDIFTTSYKYTRGWHCCKCGRVSSRYSALSSCRTIY